jgi:hypothetical protein
MKKLLLGALICAAMGSTSSVQAGDDSYTHLCECERENRLVDCNAECKTEGGWSGKAILSNKSKTTDMKGVTCYCKNEKNGEKVMRQVACEKTIGGKCGLGRGGDWKKKITAKSTGESYSLRDKQQLLEDPRSGVTTLIQ